MPPNPDELAGRILCRVKDLEDTHAKDIVIHNGDEQYSILIVDWKGKVHAFVNSCPHSKVPLNLVGDKFFDRTGNYLLCTMHGAHFRPDDGYCTLGPCRGKSLRPFPIKVHGGNVIISTKEKYRNS